MTMQRYDSYFRLFLGTVLLSTGLFVPSSALAIAGVIFLLMGVIGYRNIGATLQREYLQRVMIIAVGIAIMIDGFRISEQSLIGTGMIALLWPFADAIQTKVLCIESTFADLITFIITVIVGLGLGPWLYTFVIHRI